MIDEKALLGFLKLVDLKVEERRIPDVLSNLQRMEQVAAAVNSVELGPEDEIGPEWRP